MMRLTFPTLLFAIFLFSFSSFASDTEATALIIRGYVSGLAVDGGGNKYVTGSFYDSEDFNPGAATDTKTPVGWTDLFVTRYNADGSYSWTQTFGVAQASHIGTGIVVANGTLFVCGERYQYIDPTTLAAGVDQPPSSSAIVIAFDAVTGAVKTGFGTNGVASYGGVDGASAGGIATSGSAIYVTGIQYPDYIHIQVDPSVIVDPPVSVNPTSKTFVWALSSTQGATLGTFNGTGVVTLDDISGENSGRSIAVADGSVFVAGSVFQYNNLPKGVTPLAASAHMMPPAKSSALIFPPYFGGTRNAFVASLNATTGALNAGFASNGIKQIGGTDGVSGDGLAVANGVVYVTGGYTKMPASNSASPLGSRFTSDSNVYVLAVDENTGLESATFGTSGMITFGRQFSDEGVALAVAGGVVYVTGSYGNLTQVGGYFYPYAGSKGPIATAGGTNKPTSNLAKKNLHRNAPPNTLNGGANAANATNNLGAVNSFGLPNKLRGGPVSGNGMFIPIGGFGGGGLTDAFVLALDAGTGARKTNFSGDGLQTFGGSDSDGGVAIATSGSNVIVAGFTFSSDAGIGGIGVIDASGWNSFLLTLDMATGGGGGAEQNIAPIVHAGDPQTAAIPQFPNSDFNRGNFEVHLDPIIVDDVLPSDPGTVTVAWAMVSGPGTVTFDDATSAFTGANFSAPGTYVLRVTANDGALSGSDTTMITVTQNHAPVMDSTPVASPSPAITGQEVTFTAAAHDADGDDLNYFWDFGDNNYGYDASTTNTYLAPGTYTVNLHVDDGVDEVVTKMKIIVTGDPIFSVDDLQFCVDFSGKGHSAMRVGGLIGGLPKAFNAAGTTVVLNAGGVTASFTLDKNGRAKTAQGTFALGHKGKSWTFVAKLNSATIDTSSVLPDGTVQTNALGLANSTAKNSIANVPVTLNVGSTRFSGNKVVSYSTLKGQAKGK